VVKAPVVAKNEVDVELVVVEFRAVKFCKVEEPRERKLPKVPRPELLCVVEKSVVAKNEVDVELVVVELVPVKSWRVEEPVTRRLERVVWPEVTPRVPGKT